MVRTIISDLLTLFDLYTLVGAVFISLLIPIIKRNASDYVNRKINKRRRDYEEKQEWLSETKSIAEKIEEKTILLQQESESVEIIEDEAINSIQKVIDDISMSDVSSQKDVIELFNSRQEYLNLNAEQIQLDNRFDQIDLQNIKSKIKFKIDQYVSDEVKNPLSEKIENEYYNYQSELIEHYAYRELDLDQNILESYFDLRHLCFRFTLKQKITDEDVDELDEVTDELYAKCTHKQEQLRSEYLLRNRILDLLGSERHSSSSSAD